MTDKKITITGVEWEIPGVEYEELRGDGVVTDRSLLYKIAQMGVYTWDLDLQWDFMAALVKVVRIMDKQTEKSAAILEKMKDVFVKWREEKISDANLHGIYKDIEDILDDYELEEAMEE